MNEFKRIYFDICEECGWAGECNKTCKKAIEADLKLEEKENKPKIDTYDRIDGTLNWWC